MTLGLKAKTLNHETAVFLSGMHEHSALVVKLCKGNLPSRDLALKRAPKHQLFSAFSRICISQRLVTHPPPSQTDCLLRCWYHHPVPDISRRHCHEHLTRRHLEQDCSALQELFVTEKISNSTTLRQLDDRCSQHLIDAMQRPPRQFQSPQLQLLPSPRRLLPATPPNPLHPRSPAHL